MPSLKDYSPNQIAYIEKNIIKRRKANSHDYP